MSVVDPLSKVEAGLKGTGDKPIPLQSVHIRAKLLDLAAQVGQFVARQFVNRFCKYTLLLKMRRVSTFSPPIPSEKRRCFKFSSEASIWAYGLEMFVQIFFFWFFFPQVIVFQQYNNNSSTPIEAKYVFPLDDMAAGLSLVNDLITLLI